MYSDSAEWSTLPRQTSNMLYVLKKDRQESLACDLNSVKCTRTAHIAILAGTPVDNRMPGCHARNPNRAIINYNLQLIEPYISSKYNNKRLTYGTLLLEGF